MRNRDRIADLLNTAQEVFRDDLLACLPRDKRYKALMVMNAMGIAARHIEAGDRPLVEARKRLAAIYRGEPANLANLEKRLSADIRSGRFDPGSEGRAAVVDHLREMTSARALQSNPKSLRGRSCLTRGTIVGDGPQPE